MENQKPDSNAIENANFIQSLLDRIKNGEDEKSVRNDFIDRFRDSEHAVIMHSEQILLDRGISPKDLHIFFEWHGELAKISAPITHTLAAGHPIQTLNDENQAIEKFLQSIETTWDLGNFEALPKKFMELNAVRKHYMKKEGLVMPVLYRNGFTGPSTVMWDRDDEIKRDVKNLARDVSRFFDSDSIHTSDEIAEFRKTRVEDVFAKIRDMISREERVFFPVSLQFLSQEDWLVIYRDMFEYGFSFIEEDEVIRWAAGEVWEQAQDRLFEKTFEPPADYVAHGMLDGKIKLPTGEISIRQLEAVLKILPIDITFIDAEDTIQFFMNEGKVFPRPKSSLGQNVLDCHPPKLAPMIKDLIEDFKAKRRTNFEVCKFIMGKPISVNYLGVYDEKGKYIGAVEFVQNLESVLDSFKHVPKY